MNQEIKQGSGNNPKSKSKRPIVRAFDELDRYTKKHTINSTADLLRGYVRFGPDFGDHVKAEDDEFKTHGLIDPNGNITQTGMAFIASSDLKMWVSELLVLVTVMEQHFEKAESHKQCHIDKSRVLQSLNLLRDKRTIRRHIKSLVKMRYLQLDGKSLLFRHDKVTLLEKVNSFTKFREMFKNEH